MKNINNLRKKFFTSVVFIALALSTSSCDPSIDSLAFDLAEEDSIEDETAPKAEFFFESVVANNGLTVNVFFTNLSTSASTYLWTFSDGQTSTEVDPIITFDLPDVDAETIDFDVVLVASDNHEVSSTASNTVSIKTGFEVIPQITDGFTLINTGESDDPISVFSFSSEEANGIDKFNYASNLIDKDGGLGGDITKWTANDETTGDNMDDGEFVIFDLGSDFELGLIQFTTDARANLYGYQILTSTTGTSDSDFSVLLPEGGDADDLAFSEPNNTEFQATILTSTTTARYIKLITYGRFNVDDTSVQTSKWSNFNEIEFWSTSN